MMPSPEPILTRLINIGSAFSVSARLTTSSPINIPENTPYITIPAVPISILILNIDRQFPASSLFGFSSLVFIYIGYLAGIFYRRYEGTEIIFPLIIVSAGDLIYEFLSYIGNFLLHNRLNIVFFLTRFIIPEMIYTMLAFVILYKPLVWLNSHLNVRDKRRVNKFDERNI